MYLIGSNCIRRSIVLINSVSVLSMVCIIALLLRAYLLPITPSSYFKFCHLYTTVLMHAPMEAKRAYDRSIQILTPLLTQVKSVPRNVGDGAGT